MRQQLGLIYATGMSDRTGPALASLDALIDAFKKRPHGPADQLLLDDMEALRRAVAAFHMEAIRFRMYSVDRALKQGTAEEDVRQLFETVRHELETAGFHTRSHTAP